MAPRDFSTDGAFGATEGGSIPGVTMNDPGPGSAPTATPRTLSGFMGSTPGMGGGGPGMMGRESFGGVGANEQGYTLTGDAARSAMTASGMHFPGMGGVSGMGGGYGGFGSPSTGGGSPGALPDSIGGANNWAGMFAGGGMIPSVPGSQSESGEPPIQPMPGPLPPTGNPFGTRQVRPPGGIQASWKDELDQAMQTVDATLDYGRKLHGLPSNDPDQQTKQLAQRMPAVPGSQSESGIPPQQPMPGPLPPNNNPFGKRGADNSDQQDQPGQETADAGDNETPGAAPQQTAGAIPDDEHEETA